MSRAEFPQFSYDDLLSFVMVSQFLYRRHEKEKGAFRKYPSLLSFTDQQFEGVADIAGFFQATEILHYLAVYTETYPSKTKVLAVERNLRYKKSACVLVILLSIFGAPAASYFIMHSHIPSFPSIMMFANINLIFPYWCLNAEIM